MQRYDRKDTIVCSFEKHSPRISAYEIHEWIHRELKLDTEEVEAIQIDGVHRQVFIKMTNAKTVDNIISRTKGEVDYAHETGEISKVTIGPAGLGKRSIRIANLPPEMPKDIIKEYMSKYGIVNGVTDEKWSNMYRYAVGNGIRIATIDLRMHIPSHLYIAGYRTLISYIGQPTTCYICNGTTHIANECPSRQKRLKETSDLRTKTWAQIATTGPQSNMDLGGVQHVDNETQHERSATTAQQQQQRELSQTTPTMTTIVQNVDPQEKKETSTTQQKEPLEEMGKICEQMDVSDDQSDASIMRDISRKVVAKPHSTQKHNTQPIDSGKRPVGTQNQRRRTSWAEDEMPQDSISDTGDNNTTTTVEVDRSNISASTDDEQVLSRPPFARYKKPRTTNTTADERNSVRSTRRNKLSQ